MLCQESFGTHEVALANDSLTPDCTWFHIQGTCPFQLQTLSYMFDHNSIIIIVIHYLIISWWCFISSQSYLHMTSFVKYLEYKTFRRLLCTWQGSRRCTSRSRISVAWAPIPCAAPRWVPSDACRNGSVAAPPSRSARTGWSLSFAHQVPMKWTIWGTRSMYNIV